MITQLPGSDLTPVEQSLVEHVGRGEWLDLEAKAEAVDEAAMRSWGDSRTCRATVIRDILRGKLAADPDPHGLRLRGARISGRLDLANLATDMNLALRDCLLEEGVLARDASLVSVSLAGCQLNHRAEPPLDAENLTCTVLDIRRTRISGSGSAGAVRLAGARIDRSLICDGASLRNDFGPALSGALQVGQSMFLSGGFAATGAGEGGAVRLLGAHIGLNLHCDGASLRNESGSALLAHSLQVGQGLLLQGGFTATGIGNGGTIRLTGAHLGGSLECDGASLRNDSGPALSGDALLVDGAMFLRDGFTATGAGGDGAVRLRSARIGGSLDCAEAALHNDSGPGLNISGLQVGQGMYLRDRFKATGAGDLGTVNLAGARIGGSLHLEGATLHNESGPALVANTLQVGRDMYLRTGFAATTGSTGVVADLTGVRVGGMLFFDPAPLEPAAGSPGSRLAVDGLTYTGVPQQIPAQEWLDLLRHGTPGYAAQPYQQLAAGYRALGDDRQARQVLIAQRDDQLTRVRTGWPERLWGKITKATLGYGYKPWRALLFLAAVVAISCLLAVELGSHGALTQTIQTATPGRPCTVIQQVSVGLDLNLPVGTSLARPGCELNKDAGNVTEAWLTAVGWVLQLLAWVFAALFIAGFTSAVRKT